MDCLRTGTKINKLETLHSESASENGPEEAQSPMTKYLARHTQAQNPSLAKPKDQAKTRGILKQVESQKKLQLKKARNEGAGAKQKLCRSSTDQAQEHSRGKAAKEPRSPPQGATAAHKKKLSTPDRFVAKNNYAK